MKKSNPFGGTLLLMCLLGACKKNDEIKLPQILANTDMETGSQQPENWTLINGNNYSAEWTTEEASSKSHSLKISSANSSPDYGYWSQNFSGEMPINKDLTLTVRIKAKNLSGQGAAIAIRADGPTTTAGGGPKIISTEGTTIMNGTFDWTTYTLKMSALRTDAKVINVFLIYCPNTTGTVYFDDAMVTHN